MGDVNIQGHMDHLRTLLLSPAWKDFWDSLSLQLFSFADFGLEPTAPDNLVWEVCQREQIILITANRNQDGPDSLETSLRTRNEPSCLPVMTFGDAQQFLEGRAYAERTVERLLGYLFDIDRLRGTGRLYLP
jgi:hypothetical protein